jgi:hypothetical protein
MQSNYPIQSFPSPAGLTLRQTIKSDGAVTVPPGVPMVYAIVAAAGGSANAGWTIPASSCVVGTSYGTIYNGGTSTFTSFTGYPGVSCVLLYY